MKATGPGTTTVQSVHRRKLLARSARLGVAGLLANPLRMFALAQDAAKTQPEPVNVHQRVTKIIVEHIGVDEKQVVPTARFKEDLGADSLDVVELSMAFEEAFDIELPCDVENTWKTVGDAEQSIHIELDKKKTPAHL